MEINGKSPLIDLGTRIERLDVQEQQAQSFRKAAPNAVVGDSDRVELSVRSRGAQQIGEWIRSTPDVREALVERIRSTIENGTYNVRAEQVADKVLGGNLIDELF